MANTNLTRILFHVFFKKVANSDRKRDFLGICDHVNKFWRFLNKVKLGKKSGSAKAAEGGG